MTDLYLKTVDFMMRNLSLDQWQAQWSEPIQRYSFNFDKIDEQKIFKTIIKSDILFN